MFEDPSPSYSPQPSRYVQVPREQLLQLATACLNNLSAHVERGRIKYIAERSTQLQSRFLFPLTASEARAKAEREAQERFDDSALGFSAYFAITSARKYKAAATKLTSWPTIEVEAGDIRSMQEYA